MARPPLRRIVAALGLLALIMTIGSGCAASANSDAADPGETSLPADLPADLVPEGDNSDGGQVGLLTSLDCGVPIEVLQSSGADLAMTSQFPPAVDGNGDGAFAGSVTVTGTDVSGIATPEADVYLVQSGAVVSTPAPKDSIGQQVDLGADGTTFAAPGSITSCESGEPLPAGAYDIYAAVVINQEDGSIVVVAGGPWPLTVN